MARARGGVLLAFEGIDGSGKTTQAERLVAWIGRRWPDWRTHLWREPGATSVGEAIRDVLLSRVSTMQPLTEVMLYMSSRAELYAACVRPALEAGELVVLDRSHYSTVAYQGAGLGVPQARILELARIVTAGCGIDRVVFVDVPAGVAAARRAGRADRIEQRGEAYYEAVADGYRAIAAREPQRFECVDGDRDADVIVSDIRARLEPWLAERRA